MERLAGGDGQGPQREPDFEHLAVREFEGRRFSGRVHQPDVPRFEPAAGKPQRDVTAPCRLAGRPEREVRFRAIERGGGIEIDAEIEIPAVAAVGKILNEKPLAVHGAGAAVYAITARPHPLEVGSDQPVDHRPDGAGGQRVGRPRRLLDVVGNQDNRQVRLQTS